MHSYITFRKNISIPEKIRDVKCILEIQDPEKLNTWTSGARTWKNDQENIRRPLLVRGHQAARHYVSVSRFPVSVSGSLESGFRDPGIVLLGAWEGTNYPQPGGFAGSGVTPESAWKVTKFQASLQGIKNHENSSKSHQKSWKSRTWNHKKSNFCESWFLQYRPCQMHVFPIPGTDI